jgi:hypothetical protein
MNTSLTTTTTGTVKIQAAYSNEKHLGHWTTARSFEVRARRGSVVLDLRSAQIPEGDIELHLDLDHSMVKLLVPEDSVIDQWDLEFTGRGRVKQTFHEGARTGRTIKLAGRVTHGEVRVNSGGIAQLSAMFTKEYVKDARRAHRDGDHPSVDDPARTA